MEILITWRDWFSSSSILSLQYVSSSQMVTFLITFNIFLLFIYLFIYLLFCRWGYYRPFPIIESSTELDAMVVHAVNDECSLLIHVDKGLN